MVGSYDQQRAERYGFTIVELIVVIAVIAILAAITIVAYNGIQQRARTSAQASELSQVHRKIQAEVAVDTGNSIAIKPPIVWLKSPGTMDLSKPLRSAKSVTIYGVFKSLNSPSDANWSSIVTLSPTNSNNALRLRSGASTDNTARGYYSTSSQPNRDLTRNNILNNTSRHIGWITANSSTISSSYDLQTDLNASLDSHTGWDFDTATLVSNGAYTGITAFVFDEYHDAETRAGMISWLNKEYGVGL